MDSTQQLYSLTWSEYSSSLASSVQLLRCRGDLVDVTLAAGGRSFPAHKIVLSAASPFLLNIFKTTPCKHPVVLLAGMSAADLEALLEFIYRGEVSVDPEQLPSLLQAADCLSIQGLIPTTTSEAECAEPLPLSAAPSGGINVALTRDVINSFLPLRTKQVHRKRTKRRSSESSGGGSGSGKWARLEQENGSSGMAPVEHGGNSAVARVTGEQCNTDGDVGTSVKSRGASDQPGVCPVCGATLRQARNLRRHLLASCKNRANSLIDLHQYLHQSDGLEQMIDNSQSDSFTSGSEHIVCPVSPPPVETSPTILCNNQDCFLPAKHT